MTPLLQISLNISAFKFESLLQYEIRKKKPSNCYSLSRAKLGSLHDNRFKLKAYGERWSLLGGSKCGDGILTSGNLALAIGLTYLSFTGQLGWVLDAIVSVWLFAVLVPIVGLGAFLWWAGRDIVQGTCPNCGNDFQVFKSSLNDDLQFCPFCTQPFSVVDDKFVRDSVQFSNESTTFGQAFNDFSRSKRGKDSSKAVVDVEAEIKDAD
ncbi:uncharacterized protein LOC112032097 [Quercus suber]|uniref:uncharacterized protein LOC112032097 n=1 Tax=Quercus suber TaxID=58331 RepID=UPI0032DEF9B7